MNQNIFKTNQKLANQNLQIITCAGAGKTEFISNRIAYLISERITKPENIVAFTFTERAAKELKFRIRKKIRQQTRRQYDIGDIYIGTIHGFCHELLKEYMPMFRGFDVLDEKKRFAFVNAHRREVLFDELSDWLIQNSNKPYGSTPRAWVINTFIRGIDITREEMK